MDPSDERERLSTDQWIWRRNRSLAGLPLAPEPTRARLRDDLPMPAWQTERNRQAADGRGGPLQKTSSVQAVSDRRTPPPIGSEIPTVRDGKNPVRLRRMADGTFEPVPGHVTRPFAFDEWARNIDWPGFVDDLLTIKFGAAAGAKASAADRLDKVGLLGGFYATAKEAWNDATNPKPPPHHR